MCATIWIGGMVLFGVGALVCAPQYAPSTLAEGRSPKETEYPYEYRGFWYRINGDKTVTVNTSKGPQSYASQEVFREAVRRIP